MNATSAPARPRSAVHRVLGASSRTPVHPGHFLETRYLAPLKLTQQALAQALGISRRRVNELIRGRRGITADTAFRLARYFGTTPDFCINLQARHDLEAADRKLRRRIERKVRPRAAWIERSRVTDARLRNPGVIAGPAFRLRSTRPLSMQGR